MEKKGLRKWQKVTILCGAIGALVGVNLFAGRGILRVKTPGTSALETTAPAPGQKNPPPEGESCPHGSKHEPAIKIAPIGSPQAKVKLKAFAQSSNPCQEPTIDLLKKVAQAFPHRFYLEFVDTGTEQGISKAQEVNLDCAAGLMVNGKFEFQIEMNGKQQMVAFNHGPVHMMPPEVLTKVLAQELRHQYGKAVTQADVNKLSRIIKKAAVAEQGQSQPMPVPRRRQVPHPALEGKI